MKHRILNILYDNIGDFVSGEHIASLLSISRVAVKKHIDSLILKGYNISSVKKSGYMLTVLDDIFDETSLKMFFSLKGIDIDINFLEVTDSTNVQAKKFFNKSNEGIVTATIQTAGKGRKGRSFESPEGGIYISYYCRPQNITPFDAVKAVIGTAVAVNKTLNSLGADCKIKWTNDVFYQDKKICGILCEMLTESEKVEYLLQGTGININNTFTNGLKDIATSLSEVTGKKYNRAKICADFIFELKSCNDMLFKGEFKGLLEYYKQNCYTLGKHVTVSGAENYTAFAVDIDENGFLIVKTKDGFKTVIYGDVSVKAEDIKDVYGNAWY